MHACEIIPFFFSLPDMIFKSHISLGPRRAGGMLCVHSFHISRRCYFLCSFIRLSNKLMVFQPRRAAAAAQVRRRGSAYLMSFFCALIKQGGLNFQVAWPTVAAQCERLQEGYLSLAARWPQAKSAEEPHSLHPLTRT